MQKKNTTTGILCELTRLKSQQKYLECSRIKFNLHNLFDDENDKKQILEIEKCETDIKQKFNDYFENTTRNIQDAINVVEDLKGYTTFEKDLEECTMTTLRERILNICNHLKILNDETQIHLNEYKKNCLDLIEKHGGVGGPSAAVTKNSEK